MKYTKNCAIFWPTLYIYLYYFILYYIYIIYIYIIYIYYIYTAKLQKVILFSSTLTHSQRDAGNITFYNFLLSSMCKSLNAAVNKCIN